MDALVSEEIPSDPLSVGATRPVVVSSFLHVPMWAFWFVAGIPVGLMLLTSSFFVAVASVVVLGALARWSVRKDHYRPRSWWLAFISGALWADTRLYGGASDDPLGDCEHATR